MHVDSQGIEATVDIPDSQRGIVGSSVLLKDPDKWGSGPDGSATDFGVRVNGHPWVFQVPRRPDLLAGPAHIEIELPAEYFHPGTNTLVVKDILAQFESASWQGKPCMTLRLTVRGGDGDHRIVLDLEPAADIVAHPLSRDESEALTARLGKKLYQFLRAATTTRGIDEKRQPVDPETLEKLRSLGYIK